LGCELAREKKCEIKEKKFEYNRENLSEKVQFRSKKKYEKREKKGNWKETGK
jgi:hypothetical protein